MKNFDLPKFPICGVYLSPNSKMNIVHRGDNNSRLFASVHFEPFVWSSDDEKPNIPHKEFLLSKYHNAELTKILKFADISDYSAFLKNRDKSLPLEKIPNLENQFLLMNQIRMFEGMQFNDLKRMQLDIETYSSVGFSNPHNHDDRIIAVGILFDQKYKIFEIENMSDEAEKVLLQKVSAEILKSDPDTIEGHNIFKFDLEYISVRSKKLKLQMNWGRFNSNASFRKSRIRIAERMFEYPRCDIPGRTVVDTLLLLQIYDISKREMTSYSLKDAAIHFNISNENIRTYIDGNEIKNVFTSDRKKFRDYLKDDLRETKGLADRLLPTYFAQVQNFPLTFQECILKGSGIKVEYIFLEKYFQAQASLPKQNQSEYVTGGYSESFEQGVFKNVLHYDVASLYPSIMLLIGKCPSNDYLNIFLNSLREFRNYRLEYKKKAKETTDALIKNEYEARQQSFKILINSFYGYLGLSTARFSDSSLADEITSKGREILIALINDFKSIGCKILEVDTDGIYLSCGNFFSNPNELLNIVSKNLPNGIDLEFDGAYPSMFCYKSKNYALLNQDNSITLKGSALRNRSIEGFLKKLTNDFIMIELGVLNENIFDKINSIKNEIESGNMPISELAKCEYLSSSLDNYSQNLKDTGKGRRAVFEAALKMSKKPTMGERVCFYVSKTAKKNDPDWKKAQPIESYNTTLNPYDQIYYIEKLKDWIDRFSDFLEGFQLKQNSSQGELFDL